MAKIVVTGVSSGIGEGVLKYFVSQGFHVFGSVRNRKDDILKLSESFLIEYSKEYKTSLKVLDEDVQKIFQKYYWPGNIRELQNLSKYLSIVSTTLPSAP